jgi:hypothetical protein
MDGSRASYLNTVATEIWARFWFYSSPTDLRRLVLVCRYFRDICQPFLFQRQRFRAPDSADFDPEFWLDSVRDLHRSTIRLRKLGGSIHASSVRSWNFDGHDGYASLVDTHPNILNITSMEETYLKLVRIFADTLAVHAVAAAAVCSPLPCFPWELGGAGPAGGGDTIDRRTKLACVHYRYRYRYRYLSYHIIHYAVGE